MNTKYGLSKKQQSGFTLLETLVAFAILVLVLGVVFQVFANGARTQRLASEYSQAFMLAQSCLTLSQYNDSKQEGKTENGYRWRIEKEPFKPVESFYKTGDKGFYAEKIVVIVSWESANKRREITLDTIRLRDNEK